jgi:DNA-binding NarL/FixJ family response regulator
MLETEPGEEDELRVAAAALGAALEAIPSPAFVVRHPGTVLQANGRGRALLDADPDRVLRALSAGAVEQGRFPVETLPGVQVVVLPDLDGDARARLVSVTRRWILTPRQSAVLALVAQGESNRTVAARLGCSEKTVELHVSALLAKTHCASRAQLVAAFWTDAG